MITAANDNVGDALLASNPRARLAVDAPLLSFGAAPSPSCRNWHVLDGVKTLSSIVAIEGYGGPPRWRASVTIWGHATEERLEVANRLAYQLLSGVGTGATTYERIGSTLILRRYLSTREAAYVNGKAVVDR